MFQIANKAMNLDENMNNLDNNYFYLFLTSFYYMI